MASMRTIGVRLRMETGDYTRDTERAGKATDRLRGRLGDAGTKGKADLDKLAMGAGILGAALVGVAGAAVYAAMGFDKQMSEVQAVSNATAGELDALRQAAIAAGAATVFSAKDAAEAEAELAKAGISTADILGGALTGSLDLAAAGSLDLAQSAEIASAAMNTFGLSGKDVGHVADVLSAAANKSAAGVDDLGMGLQQVGLVAAQAGLSFEETVGLLAAMADRGLKGSDGATSLKTALQRLVAPTEKSAKTMESLGISMYDSTGNMVSAADIAGQLQTALKDLTPAQRNAALQTMFGSDAIRAANVLYTEGAEGIQDYIKAVDDQGAASRVAATKLDNLAGDVEQLTGSLETLFITSGEGASGGLRFLVQQLTGLTNMFGALPGPVQSTAVVVVGLTGVALLAAAAGLKLRGRLSEIVEELSKTGPAGARAGAGIQTAARWAGRATVAFAALTVAGEILRAFTGKAEVDVQALNESLERLGKTGKVTGELVRIFGENLGDLGGEMAVASSGVSGFAQGVEATIPLIGSLNSLVGMNWTEAADKFKALDQALAEMQRSGHGAEADAIFRRLWQSAQDQGVSLEALQSLFPGYIAAYREAQLVTSEQGTAAARTAKENKTLAGSLKAAMDAAGGLKAAFDDLHGAEMSADEALLAAKKAVDEVGASFKENGKQVKGNSEAALENRVAMAKAADAAADAAQKYFDLTGDIEGAAKIMHDQQVAAEKAATANGGNAKQVHALADELFKLPPVVPVEVKVTINSAAAQAQMRKIQAQLTLGRFERWGGVTEHAASGLLRDAGVYTAAAPARYAFAEPGTGGEAFVPKRGDYGRSMAILGQAAGWYGADVVPRGGGWYGSAAPMAGPAAGDGGPLIVENHIEVGGEVVRVVRTEISESNRQLRSRVVGRRGR